VLFGSTSGDSVVVQGFTASLSFSKADTYVEPVLARAAASAPFTPLQSPDTFSIAGASDATGAPLVAFPPLVYHSPYAIDLSSAPASIDQGLLSKTAVKAGSGTWGPHAAPNAAPTIPQGLSGAADVERWLRERLMAAYNDFIGVAYQHHHDPRWSPAHGSPWNVVSLGYQSQGVDCTNFTSFAYADALGIAMNADTAAQAGITSDADVQVPASLAPYIHVEVLPHYGSYQELVKHLEPGDIIYIDGAPSTPTHAITWLGDFGVDTNNAGVPLVIDSTGDNPPHIDSNNHAIIGGVQIRPFAAPNAPDNNWYASHSDHVLRIIAG
jgi:cell wall-associated NlpC family hydrolase